MATSTATRAPQVETSSERPRYTIVAVTGLVLAGLAPAFLLVMALAFGLDITEDIAFFVILIAVPLIVAGLVWRFGVWAKALGVLSSLASGAMLFWMAFGLSVPASFADFVAGVMLPLGVLLGLFGSIAAIVASIRGRRETGPTRGERTIVYGALGLVVLAAVLSGVLNLTGRTTVDEAAAAGAVTATMKDFTFVEGTYEVPAGTTSTLVVRNDDPFMHDLAIPELDVKVDVLPGSAQLVELNAPAGEYTIYCTLHSDTAAEDPDPEMMTATLRAD